MCSVQSIQTVSVPQIVRSKYKLNAGSRKNLIVIKPEKCKINEQFFFLKLGFLNIQSLTPKAVIFTFTFVHLADAFIQSDLQLHSGYAFSLVGLCVFPGNRTHNLLRC